MSDTLKGVRHIKSYKPVSRILLLCFARNDESLRFSSLRPHQELAKWLSFICSRSYPRDSSCLPCNLPAETELERAALQDYYMWHFSMQGLPAYDVTIKSCELLPHIFTLPSPLLHLWRRDGVEVIFCGTFCCSDFRRNTRLFTGALLCAVRTFLPNWKRWIDSLACSSAKLTR